MSTIPNTVAGTAHTFTIIAVDAVGNTNVNYAGTITFSSSDVAAQRPPATHLLPLDAGTRTFSATLKTAGNQSLTVQDLANHLSASQNGIAVSAAAASALALSGSPNSAIAGASFSFAVSALDAFGNVIAGFGDTVHFSSSDLRATIPGNYTFSAADQGSHQFSATLMTAGAETLTVTDTSVGSVTSARASIVIQTGPTAKFLISVAAGTVAARCLESDYQGIRCPGTTRHPTTLGRFTSAAATPGRFSRLTMRFWAAIREARALEVYCSKRPAPSRSP